jgi:putative acetyltransferase
MELRREGTGDAEAIRALHRAAFGAHGERAHGEKVAALADALRASAAGADGLSLVALKEGALVGHVQFTSALLDAPRRLVPVQVLSPVGVAPDSQGEGIGSAMIRRGLELLDARRVPLVFLEGAPGYYSRFGFLAGGDLGFRRPSLRIPEPGFQAVRLAAYEEWMTGTLVYPEAFWQLDLVGLRDEPADRRASRSRG